MRNFQVLAAFLVLVVASVSFAYDDQDLDETDFNSAAANVFKVDENNNYSDNLALREARKIGLGPSVGGSLGTYGFNIEINFEDINGAIAGVGGGDGFSSFHILWKHVFLGDTVAPYTNLGYSRWYNGGSGGNYKNSAVLGRVLSDEERASGQFATDFITGALGLQYTHLAGELAGTSLYAEIVLLGDVGSSVVVPTGAVGAAYYF